MSRIPAIDPAAAQGKAKDLLDAVHKALGVTPNMFRVAAQSPAALEGLIGLNGAVQRGKLGPKVREQIALALAESNGCDYCLSAHSYLGKHAGLSDADLAQARQARAADPKAAAALRFAAKLVEHRGHVTDSDFAEVRRAGFADGEIVEIVAATVLNIFTNYLNIAADTDIDFPVVRAETSKAA
jgi:uncharacterized peroxidase-related enzyme